MVNGPVPGAGFPEDATLWGKAQSPPIATQPSLGTHPTYNDDVACYTNPIPDLNGPLATPGAPSPVAVP